MINENICNGCTDCYMRCAGEISFSRFEYQRIIDYLQNEADRKDALKILHQNKTRQWFEDITYDSCLFLDVNTNLCLIYECRPLICRLFGEVKHLPCPTGKITEFIDAEDIIEGYLRNNELNSFIDWMAMDDVFNFEDLLDFDNDNFYEV